MNAPKLVYVTQIRTTPAKLWEALTNPDFIQQYWFGCRNTSTWQVGDVVESHDPDGTLAWHGKILRSVPNDELAYTFDHISDEPASTVIFKIEPQGEMVQLTITHEDFPEVSAIRDRVKNGWPSIIEGIKTLLETGSCTTSEATCAKAH